LSVIKDSLDERHNQASGPARGFAMANADKPKQLPRVELIKIENVEQKALAPKVKQLTQGQNRISDNQRTT